MNERTVHAPKMHVTADELRRTFLAFREECIWLRRCYNTDTALYESGPKVDAILSATAHLFFHDRSRILSEYFCLLAYKISDPAITRGRTNVTVKYIDSLLCHIGSMTEELDGYSSQLHHYRELISTARNRLISHIDREAVLKGEPIGAHTKKNIEAFVENLQLYCDAVGRVVGVGPLDFSVSSGPGDVLDLIGVLQEHVDAQGGPVVLF